jgi:type I restriction enzyme, S subunit
VKTVPLKEVAEINMGTAPPGSSYNMTGQGVPMIAGAGDYGELYPKPKKWTTLPTRLAELGDLIVCVRATVGDINWADKQYCLGRGVAGLRAKKSCLDSRYLAHFIDSQKKVLSALGTGSTFLAIRKADLEDLPICVPSLAEQKRIAAILDKADALRRKRAESLKLADEFLKSVFLDIFGDPVTNPKGFKVGTIRDLASDVKYGTSKKAGLQGAFPILRMGNIDYAGNWNLNSLKYIDLDTSEKAKYLVSKGDILFNRTNSKELVGKTAVYNEDKPMAYAGYLVRLRTNAQAIPEYIGAYMNSAHGKATLLHICKSIVGMANINAQEFQNIAILIPPMKLQIKYGEFVEKCRQAKKSFEKSEVQSAELFSSLTQRAFRGDL